jgi:uncharacterized protein (TIGR02001 family)
MRQFDHRFRQKGLAMKKVAVSVLTALAVSATSAMAADMPAKAKKLAPVAVVSPWDIAFGTAFTTDYVLRGVSQSAGKPAVQGYFELQYTANDWLKLYAGIWGSSLYTGFANAEFDISGGARFTFGNFGLDLGYVHYAYPGGAPNGFGNFGEVYAKPSYKFNDWLTVAGVFDYGSNFNNKLTLTPPWIGNGTAYYYAANAVITLPWTPGGVTISLNPEIGRQEYGTGPTFNLGVRSYTYWDVGLDFNYKAVTLDLRYWDTDKRVGNIPTPGQCLTTTGHDACKARFVATLKFDTTLSALK